MSERTVIERLAGTPVMAGANNPFFLDAPDRVVYVENGHLDLFAAERDPSGEAKQRLYVGRLKANSIAFSAPARPQRDDGSVTCLMAVPAQYTVIARSRLATLANEFAVLDLTVWVDNWISLLSDFLYRSLGAPPGKFRLLEADPDVPYASGSVLTAQHLDVVWIAANRPLRLSQFTIPAGGGLLPLTERTWVMTDGDTAVSGMYTPTALAQEKVWPALDTFHSLVLRHAQAVRREIADMERSAYRRAMRARRSNIAAMHHHLLGVLDAARANRPAPAASEGLTVLQTSVRTVLKSVGGRLPAPRSRKEESDLLREINAYAQASGTYARAVTLGPDWWKKGGPSFVGLDRGGERPLALISDRRGRYRAVDPETGEESVVDGRQAGGLARRGMMFYASLPSAIKSGYSALVHVLGGLKGELKLLLSTAVLSGVLALVTPVLTGKLLAEVVPRVDVPMWTAFLGALLMGAIGSATFEVVNAIALLRIESRSEEHLQSGIWIRLLSLPARFFRRYTAGDLADRVNGVSQIRQLMASLVASVVISGAFAILSLAVMIYYSWSLTLCVAGCVLVLIAFSWMVARGQMGHQREAFRIQGVIDGLVYQMITGLAKLRVANAEPFILRRWANHYARQKTETLAARRWNAAQLTFNGMFAPLVMIAIFAFIQYVLFEDEENAFGLADYLSFNALFAQFAMAMTTVTAAISTGIAAMPLFERVRPVLEAAPETSGARIDPGKLAGDIEFADVSFRYLRDGPDAVRRLSFHIRAGERVAFVGASGSGKSTIYRLMLGFERPDAGSVFIDGYDLQTLNLPALRDRMGVVLQDSKLAAASIYKNITGATTSMTPEDAMEAARAAGLAQDIEEMPMGIHTVLPEGATGISSGQRQRLLIARALVRNPRILLLDEATSTLDNRTQAFVHSSLKAIQATLVMIAHRFSTIQDVDRIYVMENGRIVETGNYDSLLARGGVFAGLARRQSA